MEKHSISRTDDTNDDRLQYDHQINISPKTENFDKLTLFSSAGNKEKGKVINRLSICFFLELKNTQRKSVI